jgi:hypothetical protein
MAGDRVCVAGYTRKAGLPDFCVRPLFRYGHLTESWLYPRTGIIRPLAVVELDLLKHNPGKPHGEDWLVEPRLRIVQELLTPDERAAFLATIEDAAVREIFGTELCFERGWFVRSGEGERSLGTVLVASLDEVVYRQRSDLGKWEYRIGFHDASGEPYRLAVTDLAFRLHLDALRDKGAPPPRAAHIVGDALRSAARVYLRIGLARGWGDYPERCYLQVTGVYSFPDYLEGKCFADYMPAPDTWDRPLQLDQVPF